MAKGSGSPPRVSSLLALSPKRLIRLRNDVCPYCFRNLGRALRAEKEHVIGRRLVPRKSIAAQWNLLMMSCRPCNQKKSRHESVVSAVSVQPDVFGRYAKAGELLKQEAARKGTVRHPQTGRAIHQSQTKHEVHGTLIAGATFSATFVGPPQPPFEDVDALAHMQVQAIFFLLTRTKNEKNGKALPGIFCTVAEAMRSDWGNVRLKAFATLTENWLPRFRGVGASGFFKAIIRRHPEEKDIWSWALEWNQAIRVAGFLGDEALVNERVGSLPFPRMSNWLAQPDGSQIRMGFDEELPEAEDNLFSERGFNVDAKKSCRGPGQGVVT